MDEKRIETDISSQENRSQKAANLDKDEIIKKLKRGNEKLLEYVERLVGEKRKKEILINQLLKEKENQNETLSKYEQKISTLEKQLADIEARNKSLERELKHTKLKFETVRKLLDWDASESNVIIDFERAFDKFIDFANRESSLTEEAFAIAVMQGIYDELRNIAKFPVLFKRNIISVGGSFSSGKSEFINSFIENKKIRLPVGINPVTAIPTYVVSSYEESIDAFSTRGGALSLDEELLNMLTHDYLKTFGFNMKNILSFITIKTRLRGGFDSICFVDTPGYNPAYIGASTITDRDVAIEYLVQSSCLIWMVGLDSSGTLTNSDVEFLHQLNLEDKNIFVIANKADLRSQRDLESILDEIKSVLDSEGFDYAGISAYSSIQGHEYSFVNVSLFEFLEEMNKVSFDKRNDIINRLKDVTSMYRNALKNDLKESEKQKEDLSSLISKCSINPKSQVKLSNMIKEITKKEQSLKKLLDELDELERKLIRAADKVFESILAQ
ncbi:dynamin family protein [Fervidobacterium islandicum]|uniref:Dynamin family protein n=1 Tax=Fervidobacterium islandicum TaxID=2423 RepID=A0AAI8GE03_FERIS|nr:dynamin family protein [Fervidobacterium islandicum]AMW33563.1 dynamin family protein [Fervidobacterium islandicum]